MGKMFENLNNLFGKKDISEQEDLFPVDVNENIVDDSFDDDAFIDGVKIGAVPNAMTKY